MRGYRCKATVARFAPILVNERARKAHAQMRHEYEQALSFGDEHGISRVLDKKGVETVIYEGDLLVKLLSIFDSHRPLVCRVLQTLAGRGTPLGTSAQRADLVARLEAIEKESDRLGNMILRQVVEQLRPEPERGSWVE